MSFVHLHNHTEFSLLNGMIRIPDLIQRAKDFGMPSVAITDYGNLFGAIDFYTQAKEVGIKPMIGAVVFHPSHDQHTLRSIKRGVDRLFQLVLLIQNKKGYQNLCQLMTRSYLEGFYYKPRVSFNLLDEYSEGLIALSGGWDSALNYYLFEGNQKKAIEFAQKYHQIFGDRYYLELQENGVEGQRRINFELLELAKKKGLGVVATNNCHYLKREDSEAFEALLCIQTGATLHGTHDNLKFSTDGYYFKEPSEMEAQFDYAPEAIKNSLDIAQKINFDFDLKNYHFPKFKPPANKTLDDFLKEEAVRGLEERWAHILKFWQENSSVPILGSQLKDKYQKRLLQELEMIIQMGFSGYFLIVSDFIRYAKNQKIPVGPGRGSAAGSLVAYCIQMTDLDPIPYYLLFERFLNPERVSMPDVDIDFCMYGREEVLKYVGEKYGNVSQIITFGKMKARAVIRDVGRVMDIPYNQVDKIAKLVPNALNITLEEAIHQEPRLKELITKDPQINRLIEIAKRLEGLNRHASTHAAGVVISDKPLSNFLPLYKGGNDDIVTQFDMRAVEKIGLIKFDFLGLKTLTIINDTIKMIKRTQNKDLEILDIPVNDKTVFELLSRGDSPGIFQLESPGMKDLLIRLKPSTFEDLIAILALYRPGPLGSGMVDDFIERKHGKKQITYFLPELKPILEDTHGVIVYQEQVMQIASCLAGYSLGQADLLRRAMGKKKMEEMANQRIHFLKGAQRKGVPTDKAEKIFDLMTKFAEYGFNKSHSAAYALITYQTAYLKAHYSVEYLAAILSAELDNTDRIQFYIHDGLNHEIQVLPPDVNSSYYGFSVVGPTTIRYGLGAVKNVGKNAIEAIIEARKNCGGFKSFFQFCVEIDHHRVNRKVIESLIKCGAFDVLEPNRASLIEIFEKFVDLAIKQQQEKIVGQTNLFSSMTEKNELPPGFSIPNNSLWSELEKLSYEKEALGFYFSGHPLKSHESDICFVANVNTHQCKNLSHQSEISLAGIVSRSKIIQTKKGDRMAFITFDDLVGSIEVIVFSDLFEKSVELFSQENPIVIKGIIDRSDEGVKIIAKEVFLLTNLLNHKTQSVHFKIPSKLLTSTILNSFHQILTDFRGDYPSFLHVINVGQSETVMQLPQGLNLQKRDVLLTRVNALFHENVVEFNMN